MSQLEVRNLTVEYLMKRDRRALIAVQDVSFTARHGEFVAIVGPSGCGKTTVLNVIAGLAPLKSGQITLNRQPITKPGRDRSLVFQTPALLPWRTVAGNVAYGLELQGKPRRTAEEIAGKYLSLVGLTSFANSYPNELSGGMQQRANLARALAVRPEVLLCDEPLSALDAQTREHMQGELQRIWLDRPMTAIYVTHHIAEAIFLADRVLVFSESPGRIRADIPVKLPRPRAFGVQRTPQFLAIEEVIWSLLERPQVVLSGAAQGDR